MHHRHQDRLYGSLFLGCFLRRVIVVILASTFAHAKGGVHLLDERRCFHQSHTCEYRFATPGFVVSSHEQWRQGRCKAAMAAYP